MEIYTIGVFNSGESEFFGKLTAHRIDTFCDIRQRRGVRGATYAFVNSKRLQDRLRESGIQYIHVKNLAPGAEIRDLQKQTDRQEREKKTNRQLLGDTFTAEYRKQILGTFDFDNFIKELETLQAVRVAFFCVEEKAEACHRWLVAGALHEKFGFTIKHL